MKINTIELIDDLKERIQIGSAIVSFYKELEVSELRRKSSPTTWSVLECIAHLNLYYAFYIPLLNEALANSKPQKGIVIFKTGILGQFFVKLMDANRDNTKKMKAVAQMNPNGADLRVEELQLFINYQSEFLSILEQSKNYDLNSCHIPTVLSKWVTISLGDTFRFIVTHNERHLLQIQHCLKAELAAENNN